MNCNDLIFFIKGAQLQKLNKNLFFTYNGNSICSHKCPFNIPICFISIFFKSVFCFIFLGHTISNLYLSFNLLLFKYLSKAFTISIAYLCTPVIFCVKNLPLIYIFSSLSIP